MLSVAAARRGSRALQLCVRNGAGLSTMPSVRPKDARFGSGPCKKRPGWNAADALADAPLGRSHRSKLGKGKLKEAIDKTHALLELPDDYIVGILPGSDTGAFECALWSLLSADRPIDVFQWESFGKGWEGDILNQLKLKHAETHVGAYGELPDLSAARPEADVCFTWNGTTSGVCVPNGDWISDDRTGLTICDATSAVFAMDLPWAKLDVTTFSWQKVLGGEGGHGVVVLSPRAVERLEAATPAWPMPKVFRLTKGGKLIKGIFEGATINTPSMLANEDYLDALNWCRRKGGWRGLTEASAENLAVVSEFVAKTSWANFLATAPNTVSSTSICLSLDDITPDQIKKMVSLLEKENVALDIGSYRDAPPGLRIWGGATVEKADMEALMPWLEWAYAEAKK